MRRLLPSLCAASIVLSNTSMVGQDSALARSAAKAPFAVGERAQYRVSWGIFGKVGSAAMDIVSLDTVRNRPAYHLLFTLKGGIPGARINDRLESWLDQDELFSHRFVEHKREPGFDRDRTREFFPVERRWTGYTNSREESGELPTDHPLDDTAFMYYVRSMELEVGREYALDLYWDTKGNPVRLKVLRRQTVKVPAGTYSTIVVQPIIKTEGLFAEGGEAEIYFSEGPDRELVMLRVKLSVGTLKMQLEKYSRGRG